VPDKLDDWEAEGDGLDIVLMRSMTGGHVDTSSMESWLELGVERSDGSDKEGLNEVIRGSGGDLTMSDGRLKNFSRSICFPEYSSQNFDANLGGSLVRESGLTPRTSQSFVTVPFASVIWS